jgi:hypothetical protein
MKWPDAALWGFALHLGSVEQFSDGNGHTRLLGRRRSSLPILMPGAAATVSRRPPIRPRMSANSARGTATSAKAEFAPAALMDFF